jgi:mannose-6-phosphate isomerase-like protein (cupin superfamily)
VALRVELDRRPRRRPTAIVLGHLPPSPNVTRWTRVYGSRAHAKRTTRARPTTRGDHDARGRIHAHEHQEEVFLVLEGELTLLVEGVEHVLGPDQLVRVGPAARRQLTNAGSERLVLLALGGSGEHAGRDGLAWESWDDHSPGRPPLEIPLPDDLPG